MTTYTSLYTGQTISPSQVGYEAITITTASVTLQWPVNGNTTNVVANIIDVSTTNASYGLILPSAEAVSVGQSFLVNNIGSITVTIFGQDGVTTVGAVPAGKALYFWLSNNLTLNGTWENVTFGAGTSAPNAATLAGAGLSPVANTLNTVTPVSTISSNYLIPSSAQAGAFVWGGGVGTLTMPLASSVPNGWYVVIINNGTGTITVTPQGTDTINGQANAQQNPGESFVIVSSNSQWVTYGYGQSSLFVFTELVLSVTGGTVALTGVQASNVIQQYKGTLTSNCTVVFPQIVQFYAVTNVTTGSYSLTFTTGVSGGTNVVLPQGQSLILICDGKNVYNANSATISYIPSLTVGNGSAASPSLNFFGDNSTGLYLVASGQMGVAVSGANMATFTASGLLVPVGIPGGAF
jgi:hypothetical protein